MKSNSIPRWIGYLGMWAFALAHVTFADVTTPAEGDTKGISIQALPEPSYPSGDSVVIPYTIKNASGSDISAVSSGGGFSLKIVLIGPDQKRIIPYPYYPLTSGKTRVYQIKIGEETQQRIDLSNFFPFLEAGDYRVFLTQRLYGEGDIADIHISSLKGRPIDIEAEPFEFRVASPSKDKLRSMQDPRTKATPGDQLDGINNLEWHSKEGVSTPDGANDDHKRDHSTQHDTDNNSETPSNGKGEKKWIWIFGTASILSLLFIVLAVLRKNRP